MKTKLFKGLFLGFGTALAVLIPGLEVARANAKMINNALNIKDFKVVDIEESEQLDTNYFPSSYNSLEEVTEAGQNLAKEIEASGLVLLKNDNNALPLTMSNPKVSVFGSGSAAINYTPSMSGGSVDVSQFKNLKQALEINNIEVNETLWSYYQTNKGIRSNSVDGLVKTYRINEISWNDLNSENGSTFANYGDAAIVVFARDSGEGFDESTKNSDGRNGMYLGLSNEEINILKGLTTLKNSNVFKRIVVLLNSSCPIELNFLDDNSIDVDALLWVGNVGARGLEAISDTLVGKNNPSGKLSDTFVKDALSSPAMMTWSSTDSGVFAQTYEDANSFSLNSTSKYYGVYNEGIYVGYRYYETRYEDKMLNKANVGTYNYDDIVAYPFGYGLSYTSFTYSDFEITPKHDRFDIKVKVTNNGDVAGREVVEVYGQKPYIAGGVEKASVELMGFAKTKELAKNESETLNIEVKKELFKSYDNNANKTYILDEGDYYLTVGKDAHHAINNILAKKGVSEAEGDLNLASIAFHQNSLDNTTYAKSVDTNVDITNVLDKYDINKYANKGTNEVTYVSRNNWANTVLNEKIVLTMNAEMASDLQSHKPIVDNPEAQELLYNSGDQNKIIGLRGLPFDDPRWDDLLNQMTYEEQALLITNGAFGTSKMDVISLSGSKASDGPNFITSTKTNVALPSEGIWASSFDMDLLRRIGDYIAEDARINDVDTLYGPGINIHRTPFGGRSNEYFSEDPLLTGLAAMNEIIGLENKGVVAVTKHLVFNDEESARNGISIWLNEQAAREIYLLPFKYANGINYGNAHGCMSGFNRAGTDWVGASSAIQETILREEFGFEGYIITDMASSNGALYMTFDDGIMAGTDIYLGSGSKTALKDYKSSLTFKNKVRDATHRILYVLVNHSCIMNGVSPTTKIIPLTPWWDTLLVSLTIASISICSLSLLATIVIHIFNKKDVI